MTKATTNGYNEALKAIEEGRATGHALWVLIGKKSDRDGYALKPSPWEGPGSYQRVTIDGNPYRLVRIPSGSRSLPTDWPTKRVV